jgi:hypothetical protein
MGSHTARQSPLAEAVPRAGIANELTRRHGPYHNKYVIVENPVTAL